MKTREWVMLCAVLGAALGCGEKAPEKAPSATPAAGQSIGAAGASSRISGEFRLVKVATSASVFVVKDGRKSAIASWGWVVANAPSKPIETIPQSELDSYPDSGVTFK